MALHISDRFESPKTRLAAVTPNARLAVIAQDPRQVRFLSACIGVALGVGSGRSHNIAQMPGRRALAWSVTDHAWRFTESIFASKRAPMIDGLRFPRRECLAWAALAAGGDCFCCASSRSETEASARWTSRNTCTAHHVQLPICPKSLIRALGTRCVSSGLGRALPEGRSRVGQLGMRSMARRVDR